MQDREVKVGIRDLKGAAVDWLKNLKDDNHSDPADEERALRNFDSFAESFFNSQDEFLKRNRK